MNISVLMTAIIHLSAEQGHCLLIGSNMGIPHFNTITAMPIFKKMDKLVVMTSFCPVLFWREQRVFDFDWPSLICPGTTVGHVRLNYG